MSRKASDSSTKYKISNPQPYQSNDIGYVSTGPNAARPSISQAYSGSSSYVVPSSRSGPAPTRPARSARRAPEPSSHNVQTSAFPASASAGSIYPSDSIQNLSQARLQIPPVSDDYDLPVSPISPAVGQDHDRLESSKSWKAERDQRSHLLDLQQQHIAREAKLHKAVSAFTSAGRGNVPVASSSRQKQTAPNSSTDLLIGYGGRDFDDVDAILKQIQHDWPFVLDPDFAPTSLALALLPSSGDKKRLNLFNKGQDLSSFTDLLLRLEKSLSKAVKSHYQVYASSLPQHANLTEALSRTQAVIRETKKSLGDSRDMLNGRTDANSAGAAAGKRAEMVALWHKDRALREMLKTLDTIEELKAIPDRLESLSADKKYLQTALILTRAIRTITKDEMLEIGALTDLRAYLVGQQGALADILIEELSNHLYLKVHHCHERWIAYQIGQTRLNIPKHKPSDAEEDEGEFQEDLETAQNRNPRLSRFLSHLSSKPNRNPMLNLSDDELVALPAVPTLPNVYLQSLAPSNATNRSLPEDENEIFQTNPEQDSYAYMTMLLESLAILGHLGPALDTISQRISSELFNLVETTIDEVADRTESRKLEASNNFAAGTPNQDRTTAAEGTTRLDHHSVDAIFHNTQRLRMDNLERSETESQTYTLLDLFWTVYSKFRAVLEGQRVVSEVINRIAMSSSYTPKQANFKEIQNRDFIKPMQTEVRTLLHDYLTDVDRGSTTTRQPLATINDVMRNGRVGRDKQKPVFKFMDTDTKVMNQDLSAYEQTLTQAMQTHVPGLVALTENGAQARLAVTNLNEDGSTTIRNHRLLVPANPFNASILFQPYLAFITSAKETIDLNSTEEDDSSIGTFMDEFIQRVYLPQLEEKVTNLFQQAVNGPKAFLRDVNWALWSPHPVVNSGKQTISLVNSLCHMMATTPFQRENYSRLIIGIVVQYYQRLNAHYKDIVAADSYTEGYLPFAASWSQREDMLMSLKGLQHASTRDIQSLEGLLTQEIQLEQFLLPSGDRILSSRDLIGTKEKFISLAELYHTTRWIVQRLQELKRIRDDAMSLASSDPASPSTDRPALDLTKAMGQRFDAILATYEQFGDMVLYTLRIELRCRVIFYVQSSMGKTNYRVDAAENEPDPHIQDMTMDLSQCEATVQSVIPLADREFVYIGLDKLTDRQLIASGRLVRGITSSGISKIQRNIGAIQQALRNMLPGGSAIVLNRSVQYWHMYEMGPQAVITDIQQHGTRFTFDEYNQILTLQCKIDVRAETRANNRLSLLPGQMNGGTTRNAGKTFDADRTAYNDALIELHSFFM